MENKMHTVSRLSNLIHVLDDNAIQKSLIAKMLTADKMETAGHDSWEEFHYAYSSERSSCLVANYNLLHSTMLQKVSTIPSQAPGIPASFSLDLADGTATDISIILYADRPSAHDVVQGIRSGAVDFLEKPICAKSLCASVRLGIQKSHEIREKQSQHAGFRKRASQLTRRERETMALVLKGFSIKQIAASFGIGLQTAAKHRARLLNKMEVGSDAQLVQLLYARRGIHA